jgi:flagellar biosynthesis protein FlhF
LTRRLGSMLAAVYESHLDFSDMSNTPRVANGLTPLDSDTLARLMMPSPERPPRKTGSHS